MYACVAQVGCGAGNTVYPLLELNQQLRVYACDFSPRAVALVQEHPAYAATGGQLQQHFPVGDCVHSSMPWILTQYLLCVTAK